MTICWQSAFTESTTLLCDGWIITIYQNVIDKGKENGCKLLLVAQALHCIRGDAYWRRASTASGHLPPLVSSFWAGSGSFAAFTNLHYGSYGAPMAPIFMALPRLPRTHRILSGDGPGQNLLYLYDRGRCSGELLVLNCWLPSRRRDAS
jgi:hypothetical protein